ncbi:MAG: DUF4038 domain-containing protein [Mariniphaga sp.]|nr:DUF4038 domain-containing protein [Mariniphaga sp.]
MKRVNILLFFLVWSISVCAQKPAFPLYPSHNGRYLVDSNNKPFFYQTETPWQIIANLNDMLYDLDSKTVVKERNTRIVAKFLIQNTKADFLLVDFP